MDASPNAVSTGAGTASKTVTVHTTKSTVLKRYAPSSVRYDEAQTAPLRDYRRRFLELLAGVLGEVNRSRRFARVDAELGALALIGMVREILRSRPQPWSTRLAGWIVRHFLHGIGKPG